MGGLFGRADVRNKIVLRTPGGRRWRFAGAERGSRVSQFVFNPCCCRVRATEHAPRDPFRVFERRHSLADIVDRTVGVTVERHRVNPPHLERVIMILSENTSCNRHRLAQHRLGFFEAP